MSWIWMVDILTTSSPRFIHTIPTRKCVSPKFHRALYGNEWRPLSSRHRFDVWEKISLESFDTLLAKHEPLLLVWPTGRHFIVTQRINVRNNNNNDKNDQTQSRTEKQMNTEQYSTKPIIQILSSDSESSKWILDYGMWHGSPIFKAEVLPEWLYIPHVLLYAIRKAAARGFSEMLPISNYI